MFNFAGICFYLTWAFRLVFMFLLQALWMVAEEERFTNAPMKADMIFLPYFNNLVRKSFLKLSDLAFGNSDTRIISL